MYNVNGFDILIKEEHKYFVGRTILNFHKIEDKDGVYVKKIFEHSFKDCHPEFYEKYPTGPFYYEFKVFQKAIDLVYEKYRFQEKQDFDELKELFKENLIDKYEEGKSFIFYC